MSATVRGIQIVWGIPSAIATAVHSAVTAGIIQSFSWDDEGETDIIVDEDGDKVTRVDHGAEVRGSFEVRCLSTTVAPRKGDAITGLATIDGINLTNNTVVDSVSAGYAGNQSKTFTVNFTHYPDMPNP